MLLVAVGVGMLGTLWSMHDEPMPEVDGELESIGDPADVGPGNLELVVRDDPADFVIRQQQDRPFALQFQQRQWAREASSSEVDAVFEFHGRQSITADGPRRAMTWALTPREVFVEREGSASGADDGFVELARSSMASADYQMTALADERGVIDRIEFDGEGVEDAPATRLAPSMLTAIMPRFPERRLLVGEDWSYRLGPSFSSPVGGSEPGVDVEVREHFSGVYDGPGGDIAAIDRQVRLRPKQRLAGDRWGVEWAGEGTVYFDIAAGQVVASNLEVEMRRADAADVEAPMATIKATWFLL